MNGESSSSTRVPGTASQAAGSIVCPHCESEMPSNSAFCPACGWSMRPLPAEDRALATLAYLTFVPAAVLLLLPAFRSHRFVRFHAWQSVLIWAAFLILTVVSLFLSNVAAAMIFLLFGILSLLGMLFLWIVLSIKAWQGERFALPWFGAVAGRLR
jgi:uncharacterized membrane protein